MHRMIEITVPSNHTESLASELERLDDVLRLAVFRGASKKPEGDVIAVQALNRVADEVMRHVERLRDEGARVFVSTASLDSIIDPSNHEKLTEEVDEELWEEMETGLRHQSHVTQNFVILMATGGAVAAAGLVAPAREQVIAWVAASVIAPGFEPIAKIAMGFVLRDWIVLRRALVSLVVGYSALMVGAAIMIWLLLATGGASSVSLAENEGVQRLVEPTWKSALISACAVLAGVVISASYRETNIAGPVMALALIPSAAAVGAAAALIEWDLSSRAAIRLALDVALILVEAAMFIAWKQVSFHRRRPMM